MMWHNVSDREPLKEGSPWLVFDYPEEGERRAEAFRARWREDFYGSSVWVDARGMLRFPEKTPGARWTLAPGQESGEPDDSWWCPDCRESVPPECVTFDERDDERARGCGATVSPDRPSGEPDGETVEVRYAIAIDSERVWSVVGWPGASDHELRVAALDNSDCGDLALVHYGTAPVPLPKPLEIRGEVKP